MNRSDRLLVLAPWGRDAQVIIAQLASDGIAAAIAGPDQIVAAIRAGHLGTAIVAGEALASFDRSVLREALACQPAWSDCPFLLLTKRAFRGWTMASISELLGNVTILERPLRRDALIIAVRAALRARVRQRRAGAYLAAREYAEAQLRDAAATLELRVAERTGELRTAITEQAMTQAKLRESEELHRLTIELTGQIPWVADADGRMMMIGDAAMVRTGLPAAALLGDAGATAIHPADREVAAAAWQAAVAGPAALDTHFRLPKAGGGHVWYRSRAAPRLAPDGEAMRWYGTLEDIDDRKVAAARLEELQVELLEVSRVSAMGAMASILAHELNQPLTAITSYVRGSRRMLEAASPVAPIIEALRAADSSAVRAGEIVRRARDLIGGGSVVRQPEPVAELIREAVAMVMESGRWVGVTIRFDFNPKVPEVYVDRVQIQQVLTNLIRNALEAMDGAPKRCLDVTTTHGTGEFCTICVGDTGPGMPPEVAARMFEPFNTTKPGGMGIGLSISRTIIEAHGGQIWTTTTGSGTSISFTVPRD